MAICPTCGKQMPDRALFCSACGTSLASNQTPAAENRSIINQKQRSQVNQGVPSFTPPNQNNQENQGVPSFTPPNQNNQANQGVPSFTPPNQNNQANQGVPSFTPPNQNNQTNKGIPTFTPPNQNNQTNQGIPTFTPPRMKAPTFTPPGGGNQGAVCFHHSTEPAAARCARCGKYICKDCAEAYGVTSGEYAGKCLCFDCCQELVAQNVDELTRNKKKIRNQFILQLIGMVIGFIYGISMGISSGEAGAAFAGALIFAGIGGVFLSALKAFASLMWDAIKIAFSGEFGIITIFSLIINSMIIVVKCIWVTITKTIYYIKYLRQTSGFIEEDSAALQQMRDYMEYTLVRNQNKGVDLESLMSEGSELYNNAYAQEVARNGEQAADAHLRQMTTRIAENGEIIREFRDAA